MDPPTLPLKDGWSEWVTKELEGIRNEWCMGGSGWGERGRVRNPRHNATHAPPVTDPQTAHSSTQSSPTYYQCGKGMGGVQRGRKRDKSLRVATVAHTTARGQTTRQGSLFWREGI